MRIALAFIIGAGAAMALAQPANAAGDGRGGFGGYQGWGGLYRANNDVGWGPQYVLYRYAYVEAPAAVYVHTQYAHRHAVARHCVCR